MDASGQMFTGHEDVGQRDEVVGGLGHGREYATRLRMRRRRRRSYLRVCASGDIVASMLDQLTQPVVVSAEPERRRYAAVGRALADPKRLCVLESLASGELSVGDLSALVGCQVPNMSQHLAVLRSAGLVTTRRDGNTVFYRLADPRVLEAYRLIQDIAR